MTLIPYTFLLWILCTDSAVFTVGTEYEIVEEVVVVEEEEDQEQEETKKEQ